MKVSTMFATILVLSFHFNSFLPVLMFPDSPYDDLWIAYKIQHHKTFYDKDNKDRRETWEENARRIAKHNLEADMGLHSYRLELNKFSDMTASELNVYRKCLSHVNDSILAPFDFFKCGKKCFKSLPESVDWREKNLVTPVKDQGECGSCWAFSSTGALEGQNKIKSGILISLSEQNLIDCSEKQGNHACDGGWMDYAFQYVIENNGLDTEEVYPYKAKKNHQCQFIQSGVGTNCTKYMRIQKGSEKHLQAAVALIGPVSVAIDASEDKFMSYKEGVYYDKACTSIFLDHAVLVVGYGTLNGTDYWIVKNSWGSTWGMDGYILMARNARNMCGIASHAVFPVI